MYAVADVRVTRGRGRDAQAGGGWRISVMVDPDSGDGGRSPYAVGAELRRLRLPDPSGLSGHEGVRQGADALDLDLDPLAGLRPGRRRRASRSG